MHETSNARNRIGTMIVILTRHPSQYMFSPGHPGGWAERYAAAQQRDLFRTGHMRGSVQLAVLR